MPTSKNRKAVYLTCSDEEIEALKETARKCADATGMTGHEIYSRAIKAFYAWTKTPECKKLIDKRVDLQKKKAGREYYQKFEKGQKK